MHEDDASIPVLTERLTLPGIDLDFALPAIEQPEPSAQPQAETPPTATAPPPEQPPPPSAEELRAQVLDVVLAQLPATIDAVMRERLRPALDAAIDQLAAEADQALRAALSDVVEQAVRAVLDQQSPPEPH